MSKKQKPMDLICPIMSLKGNLCHCVTDDCMAWGEVERSSCYHPTSGAIESETYFGCLLIKKKGE